MAISKLYTDGLRKATENSSHYFTCRDTYNVPYSHIECGDTRGRLYVRFDTGGWVWYCHNCGVGGYVKAQGKEMVESYLNSRESAPERAVTRAENYVLPSDCTSKIPNKPLTWLQSYGITEREIDTYRLTYSPSWKRLILPVYSREDVLLGYQGRYFGTDKTKPKYLTSKRDKKQALFFEIRHQNAVCLVEDIISAIKVGRVSSSIAILGSPDQPPASLLPILSNYNQINIWLDRNKLKTALKWAQNLRVMGYSVNVIWTDLDPKAYNEKFAAGKIVF